MMLCVHKKREREEREKEGGEVEFARVDRIAPVQLVCVCMCVYVPYLCTFAQESIASFHHTQRPS